jgi:hypothetical protein
MNHVNETKLIGLYTFVCDTVQLNPTLNKLAIYDIVFNKYGSYIVEYKQILLIEIHELLSEI